MKPQIKGQQLVALFLIGVLLFNYPLLFLFSTESMVWGIPILYVFIFVAWAVLIALITMIIEYYK